MSYKRVLPRDLFNEANLLKCIGKLTMMIEDGIIHDIQYHYDGEPFEIEQCPSDGSLSILNIQFWTRGYEVNKPMPMFRPLNSRDAWPLYVDIDGVSHAVFDDQGDVIIDIAQKAVEADK
jgi:hypothetical protein